MMIECPILDYNGGDGHFTFALQYQVMPDAKAHLGNQIDLFDIEQLCLRDWIANSRKALWVGLAQPDFIVVNCADSTAN